MDIIIKIHNNNNFLKLKSRQSEQCKPIFGHVSWGGKRQVFDVFLGILRKTSNTPLFQFLDFWYIII